MATLIAQQYTHVRGLEAMSEACGRCGGLVTDLRGHAKYHDRSQPGPLSAFVFVTGSRPSLGIGTGPAPLRNSHFLPPHLYEPASKEMLVLRKEVEQVVHVKTKRIKDGCYPVPQEVTEYPAIAKALRFLVMSYVPSQWEPSALDG